MCTIVIYVHMDSILKLSGICARSSRLDRAMVHMAWEFRLGRCPKRCSPRNGWFQIQDIQDISKNDINTVQVWDDWMVPYKNGRHSHIFVESLGHCPRWRHWKVSSDLWSTVAGADFVFCLFCRIERNSRALVLNLARCSHSAGIAFVDVNFSWQQCACVALCRSASHHQPLWWLRLAWCWDEAFEKRGFS